VREIQSTAIVAGVVRRFLAACVASRRRTREGLTRVGIHAEAAVLSAYGRKVRKDRCASADELTQGRGRDAGQVKRCHTHECSLIPNCRKRVKSSTDVRKSSSAAADAPQ
jgi:hypothetical protein